MVKKTYHFQTCIYFSRFFIFSGQTRLSLWPIRLLGTHASMVQHVLYFQVVVPAVHSLGRANPTLCTGAHVRPHLATPTQTAEYAGANMHNQATKTNVSIRCTFTGVAGTGLYYHHCTWEHRGETREEQHWIEEQGNITLTNMLEVALAKPKQHEVIMNTWFSIFLQQKFLNLEVNW